MRDEAEIRGHRRTYIGAMPGKIISAMISAKSANPLMLLDEIDKLAGDFRGDPAAALLEALDPEQNSTFNDHFIDMPFDLSHVLFITTANDLSAIPGPLRDRMDVIELPSYTRVEKYNIARKHLVPKQLDACGLTGKVTFSQSALYGIIDGYTREAGVRNLERTITSVLRKCARKIASGEAENVSVTGTGLEKLLGPRMVKPEFLNRTNAIGIANGLAWTSIGGETLPIEVQVIDNGSGKITVTGSLGDVMKESAQLAITYARVHAAEYGIDSERLKKCDLHIHAPEGAVPKDGPSAGVTLTTALISCLSGIPVRGDVGHDRRDHPARQCAAHRRPPREEHGRLPRGDEDGPHPEGQRVRSVRGGRRGQEEHRVPAHVQPVAGPRRSPPQAQDGVCGPPPHQEGKAPLRLRPCRRPLKSRSRARSAETKGAKL